MSSVRAVAASAARDRLELALERLARDAAGPVLVVGPSRGALDELALEATRRRGATAGIHRKTLGGLATECAALALAAQGRSRAPGMVLDALARSATRDALAAGALGRFARSPRGAPIAATPGFGVALARTLADLDAEDLDEASLRAAGRSGPDLAHLWQATRAALLERGLATRADALRAGAAALASSPIADLPVVLLDVPLRSSVERRFVGGLLAQSASALVLVPPSDERTLAALGELGLSVEHLGSADAGPLASFRARLFADELPDATPIEQPSASLRWAPTESLEAIEVARLVLEEAARGVRFEELAVVMPSRDAYASHLTAAFARAAIPARFEVGTRRPHPAGRALLALLACRSERGSGRRLFEFLSTAQLPAARLEPPAAGPGPDDELGRFGDAEEPEEEPDEASPSAAPERGLARVPLGRWLRMLGEVGVFRAGSGVSIAGYVDHRLDVALRPLLEERARAASANDAAELERLDATIAAHEELRQGLRPVLERLDAVPLGGPWGEMLARISALAEVALRRPLPVLALLGELHPLGSSSGDVPLDEVLSVLRPRLTWLERPPVRGAAAASGVTITTPRGLLGRARRVVIVMGLAEGVFPAKLSDDPLLPQAQRARLGLPGVAERVADERLGLRLAAGCASERCHFTYPRVDSQTGRARVPSVYALEVARAISGRLSSLDELVRASAPESGVQLTWPAPASPERSIDDLEYALSTLRALVGLPAGEAAGRARFLIERHEIAARALRARYQRHDRASYTSHDGLLSSNKWVRDALSAFRLAERAYSPSALETFAACPYRFYLRAIAQLKPSVALEQADRLDAGSFGELYHECQALLSKRLVTSGLDPQEPGQKDAVIAEIQRVVSQVFERAAERLEPLSTRLFEAERARVESDLRGWLEQELALADGFRPFLSELSFGLDRGQHLDGASVREAVTISGGFKLKGAIDAIERDPRGRLRVTDYKTGRAPEGPSKLAIVKGGEMLQPLLYSLAVEALRGQALPQDAVVAGARLYFATRKGGYRDVPVTVSAENVARARQVLEVIDRAVQRAVLFARPRQGACERCDYHRVCGPNEERRTGQKRTEDDAALADLFEQLVALRSLA